MVDGFSCYQFKHKIAIVPVIDSCYERTDWVKVFDGTNLEAIGAAAFEALANCSKEGFKYDSKAKWQIPKLIGANSARRLYSYGKSCGFFKKWKQISVEPCISQGAYGDQRGFGFRDEANFVVRMPVNEKEMAKLIFKGLSLCLTPLA